VRVSVEAESEGVAVTVTDQGPGIEDDDVERIFEPFARGGRNRDPEGTGLGLTIARELARSYGGDVRVSPGKGGRFVVHLRHADPSA
jgi:signal transduction histidine kinase